MQAKVVAIIQARMASSRLPGKVLLEIAGRPMLAHVQARVSRARRVEEVLVATTTDASDDPLADYCKAQGFASTRGSQYDVLDRYYQAALEHDAGVVVRITADCPAIDPMLIDEAVGIMLGRTNSGAPQQAPSSALDFVANRLPPPFHRTFPIGLDVEVCKFEALERAWREAREPQHREHVMPYLYEGADLSAVSPQLAIGLSVHGFHIAVVNTLPDVGNYRWTVDTPEDLQFMRQVLEHFQGQDDFSWTDVLDLMHRKPWLMEINAGVRHKTLKDVDERAMKR